MTTMDYDQVFKDHVAKHVVYVPRSDQKTPEKEFMEWRNKNGCSTYCIFYMRVWGTLMVFGDCYEAVYQWNFEKGFNLAWISGCDIGYFSGKCRASPHGRNPYIWDDQVARKTMMKYLEENPDAREDFEEYDGWDALREGKFEWDMWLHNHAYDVFGDEFYHMPEILDPGRRLDVMVEMHLEGLKRAMAQVGTARKVGHANS